MASITSSNNQIHSFENTGINQAVTDHTKKFGTVSSSTGWKAVLKGEIFGYGKATGISTEALHEAIKNEYGENVANKVQAQLKLTLSSKTHINSYQAAKAVAIVNKEAAWATSHTTKITHASVDVDGKASGTPVEHTVTLTPIGILKAGNKDSIAVSSKDTQNSNAVNAWVETMESEGKVETSFVRSGVLMPPQDKKISETDETKKGRTKIAEKRYSEILSAMVESTPSLKEKIKNALKEEKAHGQNATNSNRQAIEIEHVHIGLLSANKEKEAGMASDQEEFIRNNVNGKPFQIDFFNETKKTVEKIWVKPTVRYTNFSVDSTKPHVDTATLSNKETEKTLDHYLGTKSFEGNQKESALKENINQLPADQKEEATKLLGELRKLREGDPNNKIPSYKKEGASFYSYEFQTKYSLLLAKCGIPTHVYCKSGKDRTSRFSEMLKMRATNPDLNLNKMTSAVRSVIKAFSFSGNKTIQRLCTGFSGNKQFKTYWRLIAGEKKDQTFGGWTHLPSVASYSGGGASTFVKT